MRTIHCIGDSHVSVFSGTEKISDGHPFPSDCLPPFRTYRLGPRLAYNVGVDNHEAKIDLMNLLKKIPINDAILLSYGEIDCRVHLVRQSKIQDKSILMVSEEAAEKYIGTVKDIIKKGYKTFLFAPVPTCNHYNEYAEVSHENPYPHIGKTEERNLATKAFTDYLISRKDIGYEVISIFDEIVSEDLKSKGEYFRDGVHLSQKAMPLILEKFK